MARSAMEGLGEGLVTLVGVVVGGEVGSVGL